MKKRVAGYHLNRDRNERQALFRGLFAALIKEEGIETTLAKAKSIKGPFEKLVTKAKNNSLNDRRTVQKVLVKTFLVNKLFDQIAPAFKNKKGGYLRIVKLGRRYGDAAPLVKLLFTEEIPIEAKPVKTDNKTTETQTAVQFKEKPVIKKRIRKTKQIK